MKGRRLSSPPTVAFSPCDDEGLREGLLWRPSLFSLSTSYVSCKGFSLQRQVHELFLASALAALSSFNLLWSPLVSVKRACSNSPTSIARRPVPSEDPAAAADAAAAASAAGATPSWPDAIAAANTNRPLTVCVRKKGKRLEPKN